MAYNDIIYEIDSGVAVLTLNRPEYLNAWNVGMATEISHALNAAETDDSVRAVVITGAGRAFCAGQDLSAGADTFADNDDNGDQAQGTPATMPVSVAVTKRMMWENIKPEILKTVSQEFSIIPWLGAQPDGTEGVMHFIEKRAPKWQGSVNEDLPDFS